MKEGVIVRPAVHEDVDGIVAMHADVFVATYTGVTKKLTEAALRKIVTDERFVEYMTEDSHYSISHPEERGLFVAEEKGEIVGFSGAQFDRTKMHRMKGLYVARQREGIGTALFRQAIDWHPKNQDIYLTVVPDTSAVGFQESFGFRETGEAWNEPILNRYVLPVKEMKLAKENRQ